MADLPNGVAGSDGQQVMSSPNAPDASAVQLEGETSGPSYMTPVGSQELPRLPQATDPSRTQHADTPSMSPESKQELESLPYSPAALRQAGLEGRIPTAQLASGTEAASGGSQRLGVQDNVVETTRQLRGSGSQDLQGFVVQSGTRGVERGSSLQWMSRLGDYLRQQTLRGLWRPPLQP